MVNFLTQNVVGLHLKNYTFFSFGGKKQHLLGIYYKQNTVLGVVKHRQVKHRFCSQGIYPLLTQEKDAQQITIIHCKQHSVRKQKIKI